MLRAIGGAAGIAVLVTVLLRNGDRGSAAVAAEEQRAFWWAQLGSQSAAVASFGPTFALPDGRFRHWSLVVFLPGSTEPLNCLEGCVDLDLAVPILFRGGGFEIQLEPATGTWDGVRGDEQILAKVAGLF